MSIVRRSEGSCDGVGGTRLRTRTWETESPAAAFLVVHGHGEHAGRYDDFARRLAPHGFSVFSYDQRGHGTSEGRRGHAASIDILLQDLETIRRHTAAAAGADVPLVLLGQSMGGLVALRFAQEFQPPLLGLVLVSPWLATAMPVPRWKAVTAPVLSRVAPALPFRSGLDPAALSRDESAVAAYRADRLVHDTITPRLFTEVSAAMGQAFVRADRLRAPLLLVLGDDDQIVDTQRAAAFARSLPAAHVRVERWPAMRHEPLHERERGRVIRSIRAWVDRLLREAVPNRQP